MGPFDRQHQEYDREVDATTLREIRHANAEENSKTEKSQPSDRVRWPALFGQASLIGESIMKTILIIAMVLIAFPVNAQQQQATTS